MSDLIYSVLNTTECYFPQPFITHSGERLHFLGDLTLVYLIYSILLPVCFYYSG